MKSEQEIKAMVEQMQDALYRVQGNIEGYYEGGLCDPLELENALQGIRFKAIDLIQWMQTVD